MEDKQNHKQGPAFTDIPAGGDKESNKTPEAGQTQGKAFKKKKHKRNKQSKGQASTDKIVTQHNTSHQPSDKERQRLEALHISSHSKCNQSTQTEALTNPSQNQATQTLSIEHHERLPTESKSTQTKPTRLSYKQLYESQLFVEGQGDSPDQCRNPEHLTMLTWNIDGLDSEDVRERSRSLLLHLGRYRPDVVLLQELVAPYLTILKEIMTDYEFLTGSDAGYFTGILLRRCRMELVQSNIVKYPTTEMGRNLLTAEVNFSGHQLCFMTSHLESMKDNSQERLNQLRRVWKRMREAPDSQTVIFGGDTNMRDWEMKKLGGLPDGIADVWEMLGEPEDCKYTWDTVNNNNKDITFSAKLRFDRVYMRAAREGAQLLSDTMALVGQKRLTCGRFTSDHWGILCTFSFKSS